MLQLPITVLITKGETKHLVLRCPQPPPTVKLNIKICKTSTSMQWIEIVSKFHHIFQCRIWILLRQMVILNHNSGSISLHNRPNICHQIYRVWLGFKLRTSSNSLVNNRRCLRICFAKVRIRMLMLRNSLLLLAALISITIMFTSWMASKLIHLLNRYLNQSRCHQMSKSNLFNDVKACQVQVV
jgi:hypothetical protein